MVMSPLASANSQLLGPGKLLDQVPSVILNSCRAPAPVKSSCHTPATPSVIGSPPAFQPCIEPATCGVANEAHAGAATAKAITASIASFFVSCPPVLEVIDRCP